MSSRLAHLAVLDALQVALAIALGDTAVENLRRCKDVLLA
jgi:DNA-binding MurR/RpiR family transcriptional regulator